MSKIVEALKAFQVAHAMPTRGDASDFVYPESKMRVEGNHSWGYICSKHGLGYQAGCLCCREDRERYQSEKDSQARWDRNAALDKAANLAKDALAEEAPE